MVVERRHPEDALAAKLEGADLDHHRDRLCDEDHAEHRQQQHETRRERDDHFRRMHVEPQEREDRSGDRGAEHDQPGEPTRGGDEGHREEGEDRGASREAVHAIGQVHAVRHRDDREQRESDERDFADLHLADERHIDAVDAEVPLDVDRADESDDRLPDELVATANAEAVPHVHEVVDRSEDTDEDERADRHDRLRDEHIALGLGQKEQHEHPEGTRHADE